MIRPMPTATWELRVANAYAKLRAFDEALHEYEQYKRELGRLGGRAQHPLVPREMLEGPLLDYLDDVIPRGFLAGPGFPILEGVETTTGQVDLVIDFDGSQWSTSRRGATHRGVVPLYAAAIEVRYRGAGLRQNGAKAVASAMMEVVERLQEITEKSAKNGRKCWTAAVLLGPGFDVFSNAPHPRIERDRIRAVLNVLGDFYRGRDLTPQRLHGVPRSWPFIDAIVLPSLLLKKHTLFELPVLDKNREHPVLITQPSSRHDQERQLRPLAAAKGYLSHVMKCIEGVAALDQAAWPDSDDPIYLGPYPDEVDIIEGYRALVLDGTQGHLYHAGGDPLGGNPRWFQMGPSASLPGTLEPIGTSAIHLPFGAWPPKPTASR
jgi:hypothetical protein